MAETRKFFSLNRNQFSKRFFLMNHSSDKANQGTVVNRTHPSLQGKSLKLCLLRVSLSFDPYCSECIALETRGRPKVVMGTSIITSATSGDVIFYLLRTFTSSRPNFRSRNDVTLDVQMTKLLNSK